MFVPMAPSKIKTRCARASRKLLMDPPILLVQNQLTYSVIRCIVYPVKGPVELCGAGWLISLVSIRFEDTATRRYISFPLVIQRERQPAPGRNPGYPRRPGPTPCAPPGTRLR